ncbi:MAG: HugZ family protein [Pseudorhodoplanes sp.]
MINVAANPAAAPFDSAAAAKALLRRSRSGALATLMAGSGDPYCSLVNVATAADGAPLMLISRLALHTGNILSDARVSLMLDERRENDPLENTRIMLMGRATATSDPAARRRYLARHPDAEAFVGFADFGFYRVDILKVHLVAGFGRIADLAPSQVLTSLAGADALVAAEADIVAHMNADHADAVRLYATRLLGAPDADWLCAGCDPEGLELQAGRLILRLVFPQRVQSPGALRHVLKTLAETARGRESPPAV